MQIKEFVNHYRQACETILIWAKEGSEIVRPQVAIKRSQICLECPLMIKKGFVERIFSKLIRAWIKIKHKISTELPNQERIGQCSACGCPLDSKLWMRLENIKPPDSERLKFDQDCWLFKMH